MKSSYGEYQKLIDQQENHIEEVAKHGADVKSELTFNKPAGKEDTYLGKI